MSDNPLTGRVDPNLRAKIRKQILADYGEHTMLPGNRMPKVRRLDSGSLGLNYIMGGDGYPFGMMTRLWGGFSTGKSTMIFNAFRAAQNFGEGRFKKLMHLADMARVAGQLGEAKKLTEQAKRERMLYADGLKCMYVCTERVFDHRLALSLGVKLDENSLELVMSRRIEEIGDIVQKSLLGYHVIAIDSTTGTMSVEELGAKDGIYGESATTGMTRARKWGYNMDWFQDRITPDNVLILTTQIQAMMGMSVLSRAQAERAPGGEKLNHEPAVILHFMRGQQLKRKAGSDALEQVGDKGGEKGAFGKSQAAGSELVVRCDKNKAGISHRVCLLHHDKAAARFDSLHELEKFAKYFKIVKPTKEGSSWWLLPNGEKTQSLRTELEENPALVQEIIDMTTHCAEDPQFEKELLRGRGGPAEELVPDLAAVA